MLFQFVESLAAAMLPDPKHHCDDVHFHTEVAVIIAGYASKAHFHELLVRLSVRPMHLNFDDI